MAQQPIKAPAPSVIRTAPFQKDVLTVVKQDGKELPLNIELALTPAQQARGLMYRTEMADNQGMLFVFPREAPRSFWMKNTLIPLDMIFIKRNGLIHHIHKNAIPYDLTPVSSEGDAYAVLEINGGLSERLGIKAGDHIKHQAFSVTVFQ